MSSIPRDDRGFAREKIYQALHRGKELSYDDMVEITGRSRRQCRRAIDELLEDGEPIETRKAGKVKFYSIPEEKREIGIRVSLSEEEMQALMIAANASLPSLGPDPPRLGDAGGDRAADDPDEGGVLHVRSR